MEMKLLLVVVGAVLLADVAVGQSFVEGLKCKWNGFLVLEHGSACPQDTNECSGSAELAAACAAYKPLMKVCCEKIATSSTNLPASTLASIESSSTIAGSSFDISGAALQAGMCGIYPPWEANSPPCLANYNSHEDDDDGNAVVRNDYFVVPVQAKFESAACLCEAWGGRLAPGPLAPGKVLKLLSLCTDGVAWIDLKGDACVAVYSQPTPKVDWVACESYLPVLCQFQ